ncbi:MarR family winged helix-turn-helix transcriptional regulator [Streptomyces qinglanensis]|uniref:DNA-binding transcriptional regulator, MarR family n=1 Tax=Streptomyces qinglanensis TaxID=943816 RepID=A0A1H9VLC3_9ACTN|nr:MarR family transcriptional regulator [Streptomyces qinglanensis]SES22535.1 DNA-binding transcriptional regulator, MarR family [Streptomyces qinglanensis]
MPDATGAPGPGPAHPTKTQLIELLAHVLSAHVADFTAAAAASDLTASQAKTLGVLRRSPASMRSLATSLACDASNITGIVDRLEKRALVRREVNPEDRRIKNVVLTEEGERTIDTVRETMHRTQQALDKLSGEERTELYRLLGTVFPE